MNKQSLIPALCAIAVAATATASAAAPEIGTMLTARQLSELSAPEVKAGTQTFRVIEANASSVPSEPMTRVVNAQGAVGLSRNEVVLSEIAAADARLAVVNLGMPTVSVAYYDHMKMAVLRFAAFAQAAQARERLLTLLPATAKASLPIEFAQRLPR